MLVSPFVCLTIDCCAWCMRTSPVLNITHGVGDAETTRAQVWMCHWVRRLCSDHALHPVGCALCSSAHHAQHHAHAVPPPASLLSQATP